MTTDQGRVVGSGHSHAGSTNRTRLAIAFAITTLVLAVEVMGAFLTGSLAVLVDAGHMLTDAGGLLMALLVLPLCIPALIFGVSAATAASGGTIPFATPLAILAALTLAAGALCPFAAAALLRRLGE